MSMPAQLRNGHSPVVVHPRTGEVLSPDEVNLKILEITDTLENQGSQLMMLVRELAQVTDLYNDLYDVALLEADARNREQREAQARQACRLAHTPLGRPVAKRKGDLEAEVRGLRDDMHNLRSVLSGWQSASANMRSAMGGYGVAT